MIAAVANACPAGAGAMVVQVRAQQVAVQVRRRRIAGLEPGARLYYKARGTGHFAHPKPIWWNDRLGEHWSHDYAETLTPQPLVQEDPGDPTFDPNHMWLLTRYATFREYRDVDEDGVFDIIQPKDEYRKLVRTATGFELRVLDGTVQFFDASGLWQSTVDKNGNAKIATYGSDPGELLEVSFPDGRNETFTYHADEKLASITEVGVDGVTSRTWNYIWSGDFLQQIDRPDGTAWKFFYGPDGFSRLILIGTDDSERILRAWNYDMEGNVSEIWRGANTSNDPAATEKWRLNYDNLKRPTRTIVTDPLGELSIYDLEWVGNRPIVTRLEGECPLCGSGPNATLSYGDGQNPIKVTSESSGRGFATRYTYDSNGRMTSRIEAFGQPIERETTWQYDTTYPPFPVRQSQPSTTGDPLDERVSAMTYDAAGNRTTMSSEGFESGSPFVYETTTTYNAVGQPLTLNPPGHGTDDETIFTYDPTRGNLIPLTRIDPIIGTTTFGYDAYNRRISVADPNGVIAETTYDDLDRVRFITQRGETPAEDLVTEHRYNVFGDLFQTVLPEGNVIEYLYDSVGRVVSIERKPDDDPNSHGERTIYTLDGFGNRVREEQQRWNVGASNWIVDSATEYVYSSRCHLDQVIEGAGSGTTSTTEYGYDCNGNLEHVWDANHSSNGGVNPPTTTYAYDALDRLTSVRQPWSQGGDVVTSYAYDVQDHLVAVGDAESNTTTYLYSDRDLLTRENSPVSGLTLYTYDEHGERATETDARGVTVTRTVDALDRVTSVAFPDDALDITYTYDDPSVDFSLGRLTQIERNGSNVDYRYDRFGRTAQDGALNFVYDKNSNRTEISYPGGVKALYGYDFADRQSTLSVEETGQGIQPWITFSRYHAAGPLRRLDFSNGVRETRLYDQRYHPSQITVASLSTLLSWIYSTDGVGHITAIQDGLSASQNRTYGYLDYQYFLIQGDGPWGDLLWTYDKIGNRLSETRDGVTDSYAYEPSPSGNSPKLNQVQLGAGGTKSFQYDAIGSQTQVASSETVDYAYDDAKRLTAIGTASGDARTDFEYDGRSFLRSSVPSEPLSIFRDGFEMANAACWSNTVGGASGGTCPPATMTEPTYSSEGTLMHLRDDGGAADRHVLYFAGRPVGILFDGLISVFFLSTDHLGMPVVASTGAGGALWDGGFEPFGADFSGAQASGVFLRFPGQWDDGTWLERGAYYNVHRWYEPGMGKYTRPDPLAPINTATFSGSPFATQLEQDYGYGRMKPVVRFDPLGLKSRVCCRKIPLVPASHCFIDIEQDGKSKQCGLHGGRFTAGEKPRTGEIREGKDFDDPTFSTCGPWTEDCGTDECVIKTAGEYANPSKYNAVSGPNSNTFAGIIARECGLSRPQNAGWTRGWNNNSPAPQKKGVEAIASPCMLP